MVRFCRVTAAAPLTLILISAIGRSSGIRPPAQVAFTAAIRDVAGAVAVARVGVTERARPVAAITHPLIVAGAATLFGIACAMAAAVAGVLTDAYGT